MKLPIEIFKEGDASYIVSCPRLEIYSYGKTVNTAIQRMKEIVKFYVESADQLGVSLEDACGVSDELCLQVEPCSILEKNPPQKSRCKRN
ncbi:type II toxin-antitoxin system HicB family antitoxin [Candidatus Desantisbacteria bacterium]|nr:type II toxin-antitoxin system HicB family antitoxin [Candidatus Desantisbacteria bacterium]